MVSKANSSRVFKTSWFAKAARKALIEDRELCRAIYEVMKGQADDLGGGVFKKRLNHNRHRSIILARAGQLWVFAYLFAKQDRSNIESDELVAFRELSKAYAALTAEKLSQLLENRDWMEICHDNEA
jgi:hypothetical protein